MALSTRPPSCGRPMTVSATSRSVRNLATASRSGTSPFMGTSLDDVTMIRPGSGVTSCMGRNTVWSTPTGTTVMRSGRTCICAAMSLREDCETVRTAGRARATRTCMPKNPNQRVVVKRCHGFVVCERASWRSTVIGWCRVVNSGHPSWTMPSIPVPRHWLSWTTSNSPEALRQQQAHPPGEGERLPESGRAHDAELHPVLAARELAGMGHAEGVGVAVQVQPGHGREADPGVELGPRRPGEHLDRVPQGHQLAGQVAGVHALPSAAGVAPVDAGRRRANHQAAGGAAAMRAGISMWRERSQLSLVSIHF